ncbi:E3 ubiquitin-protein ligase msl-2 isoform X2 [Scaptodrosophila lebanonensis]|nr:E3 ubiquitin-protein ligase msl-2 isoform X2 [Scaptodrosophila lebanonensis]
MSAQSVYLKIVRLSLRSASNLSKRRIDDLNEYIPQLRQLLSCVVCCQLLMDPYSPKRRRCGHHVCRLCLRGTKRLTPSCTVCNDCSDFKTYEENRSMALQLLCYKTLCAHLLQSSMFAQLAGMKPNLSYESFIKTPLIKLPPKTTQEFIKEGANYDDMGDTFLTEPDLPLLKNFPSSLPAETPPTTAATTPELPFEQHLPEPLSYTDIELEAATTAEQAQLPLPILPKGSRMLRHNVIAQPQVLSTIPQQSLTQLTAGYLDSSWNEQVDLTAAITIPEFHHTGLATSTPNFTYVLPSAPHTVVMQTAPGHLTQQMPSIGQVVQVTNAAETAPIAAAPAITTLGTSLSSSSLKRKHDDDNEQSSDEEKTTSGVATRMKLRKKNPTIISSIQVQPPADSTAIKSTGPSAFQKVQQAPKSTRAPHPCRCGQSTQPGSTTCRGSRCPCYSNGLGCKDCKCNGCQNPNPIDGHNCDLDDELPAKSSEKSEPCHQASEQQIESQPQQQQQPLPLSGLTFVALSNLHQSQHPLVLMQNENGEYQGFNVFTNGDVPVDPAELNLERVSLQNNEGNTTIAYIIPPPPAVPQVVENFVSGPFSPIESIDEFVSGTSSNAAAGNSIATDDQHPSLEDIMSDSDL